MFPFNSYHLIYQPRNYKVSKFIPLRFTMAQNSSWSYSGYTMDIGDFILVFLAAVLTFIYLFMKKELFLRIWSKCKSSILKSNSCNRKAQEQPNRMTVLSLTDWHYRGEGNEYLAISLPQKRQILRLRKRARPVGILANIKDWLNQNSADSALVERKAACFEKLNLEYYKLLVSLIGECYVQPAEEVLLVPSEIRKINKVISPLRPEHRKKKWIGYACGSLLTDYAYLPTDWETSICNGSTFAIELKPKQGWIAPRERLYNLCTYCLNQYIKLQNGETSEISQYCPMDLFSGNHLRMKHAIKCLLNTPQNNFKIFQDGVLVHGEGSNENVECVLNNWFGTCNKNSFINIEELCDIVSEALLKPLHQNSHECPKSKNMIHDVPNNCNAHSDVLIERKMCNLSHESLPRGSVLDSILNLQKLDMWGSTTVSSYLKKHEAKYANIYAHAANVVAKMKGAGRIVSCAKCFFSDFNVSETLDNSELIIQQYLMSAIFKDCSLMLTFCKLNTTDYCKIEKQNIITTKNGSYAFRIGVFDLYPKPSSCIYKHVRKQILLSKTYKQIINGNFDNVKNPIETM